MNNSLPDLTPEQLRQLNAISGLQKTRRRGADASVPSALADESESAEAPDTSSSYALPKPVPNMSEEDYERQIKEGLAEHIGAIAPPHDFIEEIVFDPWLDQQTFARKAQRVRNLGFTGAVRRSDLYFFRPERIDLTF